MILRSPYRELEKLLGYRFRKRALLELALTHPTHRFEKDPAGGDNQRLEFLGDAVLGLLIAELLYRELPGAQEGEMTSLRGQLTRTETLGRLGAAVNLGPFLRLGRGESLSGGASRASTLADALEAVIGAAYLDRGLEGARKLVRHVFGAEAIRLCQEPPPSNPKGELQELLQVTRHASPRYHLLRREGPAHAQRFTVGVYLGEELLAQAEGANKQSAEREAATLALARLAGQDPA
jgi:ribonuclease-3